MGIGALDPLLGFVSQQLYLILFVIAAYLVVARFRQYSRLSHFKGPTTTGISWWWHSKAVLSGHAERYYGDVTEKYGEHIFPAKRERLLTAKDPSQECRLST
jgi:hypothetical protein